MTPPRRDDSFVLIVGALIAANPGLTLAELCATSGLFNSEVIAAIRDLGGRVEMRGGRFYTRERRAKRPGFWARLATRLA